LSDTALALSGSSKAACCAAVIEGARPKQLGAGLGRLNARGGTFYKMAPTFHSAALGFGGSVLGT